MIDTDAIRDRHYGYGMRGKQFVNCMGCTRSYGGYHEYPCELAKAANEIDALRARLAEVIALCSEADRLGWHRNAGRKILAAARGEGDRADSLGSEVCWDCCKSMDHARHVARGEGDQ